MCGPSSLLSLPLYISWLPIYILILSSYTYTQIYTYIHRLNVNANGRPAATSSSSTTSSRGGAGGGASAGGMKRKGPSAAAAAASEDEEMKRLVALHNKKFKQESKYVPTLSFRDTRKVW